MSKFFEADCRELLKQIEHFSVSLSFWSHPYHVGKEYELEYSLEDWKNLLKETIELHKPILIPGAFMVINIGYILCFPDLNMPKIPASNMALQRLPVTREQIIEAKSKFPYYDRKQLGELLGCSEPTIAQLGTPMSVIFWSGCPELLVMIKLLMPLRPPLWGGVWLRDGMLLICYG